MRWATTWYSTQILAEDENDRLILTKMIESLPKLKVISQYAVGYDNIDISAANERGIIITNTSGILTDTTADLTWALIMATSTSFFLSSKTASLMETVSRTDCSLTVSASLT